MTDPISLRLWLLGSRLIPLAAPWVLRHRLARGREDPARWHEKQGEATVPRPEGRLIWLHAVGVGEVMALRGLILAMGQADPAAHFLVTSTARSSAQVFAGNLPERTMHQFLPLDAPRYLARFFDHWRPDLSIWAEQDLWPGAVVAADRRGIPLAMINARMNVASFQKRMKIRSIYRNIHKRFQIVLAQDPLSAAHLAQLGARAPRVMGSLKAAAPALAVDPQELERMRQALSLRRVWVAASTHPEDEAVALTVQARLWQDNRDWLLILVPRRPERSPEIALPHVRRSAGLVPGAQEAVYLADSFGELGIWYRLAEAALMGGTFGPVEGHNPWEPAALGLAVLHGARIANFKSDYDMLDRESAARGVTLADLPSALQDPDLPDMGARGAALAERARAQLAPLAEELLELAHG